MYHPRVIAQRIQQLEDELRPPPLREYALPEVDEFLSSLHDAWDASGNPLRPLLDQEQMFVTNELLLCKASFEYWANRYAYINRKGVELVRAVPLFDAQKLILNALAELERGILDEERDDGLLVLILKARQLGASTLAQLLNAHRATTQGNVFGLTASATPDRSSYVFSMFERIVDNLPPFLCPGIRSRKRTFPEEIEFETGTNLWAAAGKSTAGMSKGASDRGSRGQIGRGMTLSLIHLSEVSTWENPTQITGSLEPAIPEPEPRVLVLYESTAKGTNSFWQRRWQQSKEGLTRFTPIFIPWYAEPTKYHRRAPITWQPNRASIGYSDRVYNRSPRWMNGRNHRLTRDQLFWYESMYAMFDAEHELPTFLEEYPADDEEAFQAASDASIPPSVLLKILSLADQRPLLSAVEIAPKMDLQREHPEDWIPVVS